MTFKPVSSLTALACALVLAGCASGVKLDEAPVETRNPTAVSAADAAAKGAGSSATTSPTAQSQVAMVDVNKGAGSATASQAQIARVVYFDFDSFVVKDEFRPVVEGNAKLLMANKQRHMVVEGYTDDRGSREYNLALGQKRAEAVARSLTLLGVGPAQVEAVSFGEERPAVQGENEDAWAKNRRAELKDR